MARFTAMHAAAWPFIGWGGDVERYRPREAANWCFLRLRACQVLHGVLDLLLRGRFDEHLSFVA